MSQLIIHQLTVRYGSPGRGAGRVASADAPAVVRDLSFRLGKGEIGCLLGASGCGKTTVLRTIAGFLTPEAGTIEVGGRQIASVQAALPPEARRVGMVFQDFALFPHLDVRDNIGFGIREGPGRLAPAEQARRIDEMLALVRLEGLGQRYVHELSGGQQQRVAIARALAPHPALLLLDEPFSSLDSALRDSLSVELRAILKETGTTTVFVTHDQREAFAVSDWVGVMREGRLEQWDQAYGLYHEPRTRYVADFIGEGIFLPGVERSIDGLGGMRIDTEIGVLISRLGEEDVVTGTPRPAMAGERARACIAGCEVDVLLRPDDIVHDDSAALRARVVRKAFRGAAFLYTLELESGRQLLSLVPSHHDHAVGERIGFRLAADHVVAFTRAGA